MVKPAPASSFVMPQAELLFQLLVIAFDDPALLGQPHQIAKLGVGRQSREPILGGFGFCPRPLDQQPFFQLRRLRNSRKTYFGQPAKAGRSVSW